MRLTIPLLLVVLLSSYLPASAADSKPSLANLDAVSGYGGIAFGSPFPNSRFHLEKDCGAVKIYTKRGQNLLMGPASLEAVHYYAF